MFLPRAAKIFQKLGQKSRNVKLEINIRTYIHCHGWIPLTINNNSATHCQVFSKHWQEERNVKAEIKIQTYIHCSGWISLTINNSSATHCQVFWKSWQEKQIYQGGDKDSNFHSLLCLDSFENHQTFCHELPSLFNIWARKTGKSRWKWKFKPTFTAMVGFFWESLIFLPRTAKTFQNLGKKKNVRAQIKIQTYIHCSGWIPLTILNISATRCQDFSKTWQEN